MSKSKQLSLTEVQEAIGKLSLDDQLALFAKLDENIKDQQKTLGDNLNKINEVKNKMNGGV